MEKFKENGFIVDFKEINNIVELGKLLIIMEINLLPNKMEVLIKLIKEIIIT
jgi:hypothetical protein